jgi:hypothetical protein
LEQLYEIMGETAVDIKPFKVVSKEAISTPKQASDP